MLTAKALGERRDSVLLKRKVKVKWVWMWIWMWGERRSANNSKEPGAILHRRGLTVLD